MTSPAASSRPVSRRAWPSNRSCQARTNKPIASPCPACAEDEQFRQYLVCAFGHASDIMLPGDGPRFTAIRNYSLRAFGGSGANTPAAKLPDGVGLWQQTPGPQPTLPS